MTNKQKVEHIEQSIPVDQITVDKFGRSFQIYPWFKGRLFHREVTGKETLQKKTAGLYFKQLFSVFYGCWNIFGKYDIWAFTSSAERRLIEGKYFDRQFDYAGNECGVRMLVIELRLFKYYRYRSIASKRAISKSFFILFEELYGRLFLRAPKVKNQEVLDALNKEFGAGINEKEVVRKYLSQYKLMKFWLRLLPNPKEVFMTVGYTNFGYIRAFKEKGIKVVEFQHGLVSQNHHAYYYRAHLDAIQFPDSIATTGERETEVFGGENTFPVGEVIPAGSFIIDHYQSLDKHEWNKGRKRILVAMQDGDIGDKLALFMNEVRKLAGNDLEIIMLPRRTSSEHYLQLVPELKEVEFSTNDFYKELIESDLHATVYSTTAIEALSLGRQNILINLDQLSQQHFGTILGENPFTHFVNTPEEFVSKAKSLHEVNKQEVIVSNEKNIKAGYKENIRRIINVG